MFDYQSPIVAGVVNNVNAEILKLYEDTALAEIKAAIGYNIDKEELIKALAYDRHQYEKGYQDGKVESSVAYTAIKNACEVINDICCTAYRTRFFGDSYISDSYISEIQAALNEILEAVGFQKGV